MEEKQYAKKLIADYTEKKPTQLDQLKALDKKVKAPALVFIYLFSIFGALVLGTGLCLAMKVIGGTEFLMIVGIILGVIGIVMCSISYPIYKRILTKRKNKYSKEILEKSNQILNKEN